MTDTMTPEQRSRCMAAVKGKNTKPEIKVRKFLFAKGLRYRINNRRLPGCPDIVLPKYRTVIFVDGCFWHGHEGCRSYRLPKTNTDFWRHKINLNIARDYRVNVDLRLLGWRVIRVWECDIKSKNHTECLENLYRQIISKKAKTNYATDENASQLAAEQTSDYGKATLIT